MNTLYALIIASLSLQVWFGPSGTPTTTINVSEYSTARELLEFEGSSRDDAKTPRTTAAIPIETGLFIDEDGYTAAISMPAEPLTEDHSINTGLDFFAGDDAWDFKVPAKTDLHAIQASDCW